MTLDGHLYAYFIVSGLSKTCMKIGSNLCSSDSEKAFALNPPIISIVKNITIFRRKKWALIDTFCKFLECFGWWGISCFLQTYVYV